MTFPTIPILTPVDCLFLDVYVSGTALRNVTAASKSVMVWIHGGGYTAGSKDQSLETGIYDGTSLIQRAKNDLIVISINYRLGAFGWLAGQSMEETALPNTGLHDQRAALQWVQSYIHLLGGNRHDVSAWGESAGGGSILHHLTAQCGRLDPLFQKAVIQSPASGLMLDRSGSLERRFRSFVAASGCNVSSCHDAIACLRASNASVLKDANTKLFPGASPAPDGQLIRQIPIAEFGKGNYWKGLRSLIISHVADEGKLLAPDPAPDNFVNDTLLYTFPVCAAGEISILNKVYVESYPNATQRASSFMRDMIFAANIRAATEAYADKTWVLQYSGASGTHGSDIPATWYSSNLTNSTNLVSEKYQTYLVQHALTGNPNSKEALHWPKVAGIDAEYFSNVLDVSDNGFELIRDLQSSKTVFSLWREMIRAATDCSNV